MYPSPRLAGCRKETRMRIEAHIISFNEERIIPYTLRHYLSFCSRVILHDSFSTDGTRQIAEKLGAEVKDFDTGGSSTTYTTAT